MEDYSQGRPHNETNSNALAKKLLQENMCFFTLERHSNKLQHCFEMPQQRIWTEVPQAGTEAPLDASDEEKDWTLPDVIAI